MTHNPSHSREVENTERTIAAHLAHHDEHQSVFHALDLLKHYDSRHGQNFHRDLAEINRKLHWDAAKNGLPSMTIIDHGRNYELRADAAAMAMPEGQRAQLPHAVQRALAHEAAQERHGHHAGGARFASPQTPSDAAGAGGESPMRTPGAEGNEDPIRTSGGNNPMGRGDATPSKNGFGVNLLERLGLPVTAQNLAFLDAWQRAEGGSADNPFNTSQHMPGHDRTFNHDGVKRYDSMDVGLEATVKTLQYGRYRSILNALRQGTSAHAAANALASTSWGTGKLVTELV